MKKAIILFLIIPHFLISQKQFAPLNASWKNELHSFDCSNYFLRYNVESEIEIDGKDCSVIYAYTSQYSGPFVKKDDSLIVWENENKVYFYQFDEFHLVYDFTAEIGDSVDFFLPTGKYFFSPHEDEPNDTAVIATSLYIEDITEVDVNGILLKKFETSQFLPQNGFINSMEDIVENIGSTSGRILGNDGIYVGSGCGPYFLCYENEDYTYPPDELCEYPTSTKNIYSDNEIIFYPNPASNYLSIANKTEEEISQIDIFNMNGQHLIRSFNVNSHIQVRDLDRGIYLVKLTFDSGNIHIGKFTK